MSEDLIKRSDAIDAIDDVFDGIPMEQTYEILKVRKTIRELPSADRPQGYIHIDDVYRLIAGHSNYHGDSILSAFSCIAEGKEVTKPIRTLDE